jgi:hypothetical protein
VPGDCDDSDFDSNPDASELPGDGIDNDCDGVVDDQIPDTDGDGWADDLDCDPNDPNTHPSAAERPDAIDNDCDGSTDEGTLAGDDDNDGYCEGFDIDGDGIDDCGDGSVPGDCDDTDSGTYPGVTEAANGKDDDCDGTVDEGTEFYDDDGDGYSEFGGDCDDSDPTVHPGAQEIPGDGIDNDCWEGDAPDPGSLTDRDGDGFDVPADCDDEDPAINPDAVEICANDIDDDCDGEIDCENPEVGGGCEGSLLGRSERAQGLVSLVLLAVVGAVGRRRRRPVARR